jgi:two-component system, LuxR family, response regulator FixJ
MLQVPTVFVVDDDAGVRRSLCWLIESAGLGSEAYGSAEAFLEAYNPDRSGCLVLDLHMPGMSGFQLLEELKGRLTIPTILITGDPDHMAVPQRLGTVICASKPLQPHEFLDCIQKAVDLDAERRCIPSRAPLASTAGSP